MHIDQEKLKKIIIQSISDLRHGMHLNEIIVVGDLDDEISDGIQIHLTITKDGSEFFDSKSDFICIEYKDPEATEVS